jgi:hypothetical protein
MAVVVVGGAATSAQEGDDPVSSFLGKVADKLGVSEEQLTTAIKDAKLETVDEKVADGSLTEDQAAKIKERIEAGEPGFGFGFGFIGPRFGRGHHLGGGQVFDAAAEVLGMEKADLMTALQEDGATLNSVAEAQGKAADTFKTEVLAQVKAQLDAKVADETITQERADSIYSKTEDNIDDILNSSGPFGHHRGHRFGPWGEEAPPAEQTPTSETIFY